MNLPGITVLGPLPDSIQTITTFSAGVSVTAAQAEAARELLAHMASAAAVEIKRRNGMEPA
jgi:molybdate transport system substrate-binding protein